jgi:hypothetical protein
MDVQEEPAAGRPEEPTGFMTVEVEGSSQRLPAEHDYTGDGRPDAAVERPDGTVVVFADTADNETGAPDPDGRADEAYVVDKRSGRVIGAAHLDPETGEWVDEPEGGGAS